ncbi:uncharacterized protein [Rutidosis leptorrhynchoides]|uniref:uncharacterized protein n=1 Tax=Rutidosis leptorrhynchoides TaxID=125765 RepID=UPI003A99CF2B
MENNSITLIFFIKLVHHFFSKFSTLGSQPLFSTYVTLYTLILLYAPSFFLKIVLSPIFNSTLILLLSLLRLGAKGTSGNELIIHDSKYPNSIANEMSEKEFEYLEPRVLDHNHNQYEMGSFDELVLVQDLRSLEPRFLDFDEQRQNHVECKAQMDSCLESTQNHSTSKSISSCLDFQSNQLYKKYDHDLGLESSSMDNCQIWDFLKTNPMESSKVNEDDVEKRTDQVASKRMDMTMKLLEWNIKAPLEVIYEAYEGEEENDQESTENDKILSDENVVRSCEIRYPSLSMYYPESETSSSSDDNLTINESWETQERVFEWEDEDDNDMELIEISLDHSKTSIEFCHIEEDNLIEIDIFPA